MAKALSPSIAVYPGTFDPIHRGHLDVIKRRAAGFSTVSWSASASTLIRRRTSSWPSTIKLVRQVIAPFKNVTVESFTDLAVAFTRRTARVMLRSFERRATWKTNSRCR